jgi:hypothetical protein
MAEENGIYVPRYQNVGNDKRDYLRGFGYQGGASRVLHEEVAELEFGDFKDKLFADTWSMGLVVLVKCYLIMKIKCISTIQKRQMGSVCVSH